MTQSTEQGLSPETAGVSSEFYQAGGDFDVAAGTREPHVTHEQIQNALKNFTSCTDSREIIRNEIKRSRQGPQHIIDALFEDVQGDICPKFNEGPRPSTSDFILGRVFNKGDSREEMEFKVNRKYVDADEMVYVANQNEGRIADVLAHVFDPENWEESGQDIILDMARFSRQMPDELRRLEFEHEGRKKTVGILIAEARTKIAQNKVSDTPAQESESAAAQLHLDAA